jgi:tetratricopeptide (TPR) repeat protein
VLYFLLTGHAPHVLSGRSVADLQRAICEQPPQRPSALRPALKGDLENILLKSLHVDPARRYHSAREFADEIERYLTHRPVIATPDGWGYRLARFVERHRAASTAGALATLAVAAGTATSIYEAHRAQRGFSQVRELANRFVFDFEAAIRDTPGTLAARRMVAATARENLASLAADSGRDPALNRELAQSYYRLSRVESSAGENDPSIEHLKRSLEIQKTLRDDCCGPPVERLRYITALTDLAYELESSQTPEDSVRLGTESLALARVWKAQSPNEPLADRALLTSLSILGSAYRYKGTYQEGRKVLVEAATLGDAMLARKPEDGDLIYDVARAKYLLADAMANTAGPAAQSEQEASALVDSLLARNPENTRWRHLRILIASSAALRLRRLGALKRPEDDAASIQAQAVERGREAYTMARVNARQNPGDGAALDLAAVMAGQLGNQLMAAKQMEEVLPLFTEAGGMIDQLLLLNPSDRRYLYMKSNNLLNQGAYLSRVERYPEIAPRIQAAEAVLQRIRNQWPGDLNAKDSMVTLLLNRTDMEKHLGHLEEARDSCRRGLALAAELISDRKGARTPVSFLANLREYARDLNVPDPTVQLNQQTDVRSSH